MQVGVAGPLGENDQLGLLRIELQRRVAADDDLLAVLLLDVLADRQHLDVGENGLRAEHFDAARLGRLVVAVDLDHVDAVVRQDEAAGVVVAGIVDLDRDRAHARGQDRRHEAAVAALDQLVAAHRLAAEERVAGQRALDVVHRRCGPDDLTIMSSEIAALGHSLPGDRGVADRRAHRNVLRGDEDLVGVELGRLHDAHAAAQARARC